MPLTFPSLSHGTIAFGLFNVELDMLLLEERFFFAEPFCVALADLLAPVGPPSGEDVVAYVDRGGYPRWERTSAPNT